MDEVWTRHSLPVTLSKLILLASAFTELFLALEGKANFRVTLFRTAVNVINRYPGHKNRTSV